MATTREQTIRVGSRSESGWRSLTAAGGVGDAADASVGEPILALAHLSDLHLCDAESPARLVHLHRHGLPGAPYRRLIGDVGSYRPQEILTTQVAVTMVEAINALGGGAVTGRPFDAAVLTGDLTDNAQSNELDWFQQIVAGGECSPASGNPDPAASEWVGAPSAVHQPGFWHPQPGTGDDMWQSRWGFPTVDGLLAAARASFTSPGLGITVLAVHGNHDGLLQGAAFPDAAGRSLAEGDRRPIDLPAGHTPFALFDINAEIGPSRYMIDGCPTEPITADPRRRVLQPDEFTRRLVGAEPIRRGPGHAYSVALTTGACAVRLIALDTVNPHGGWQGSIDADQLGWLRAMLADTTEPYVIVATHHPSWTLLNGYAPPEAAPRVLADALVRTLLGEPRIIAWLAGHVHYHSVTIHRGDGGRVLPEITSAALIDWPQQSRTFELVRPGDGTLVITGTAIDHLAPLSYDPGSLDDPHQLAALSRQLSRNVPHIADMIDPLDARGSRLEQNTTIVVGDPAR